MDLKLSTPDGAEVEVTPVEMPEDVKAAADAFHRAQANDTLTDDNRKPPKRPVVDKTDPGYTPNPETKRRGRPRKEDQARTTTKVPESAKKEPLKPKDFRGDLNALGDGIWLGLSQIPVTAPYAAVIHANQAGIVETINAGAQVNAGVRNFCEKMTSGAGNAWVLQGAVVGMNIGMQMWSVFKDPDLRAQVVEANKAQVQQYVEAISGAQIAGA